MEVRFKEEGESLTVVALRDGSVLGLLVARMVDGSPVVAVDQLPEETKQWIQGILRLIGPTQQQEDANSMRNELMAVGEEY